MEIVSSGQIKNPYLTVEKGNQQNSPNVNLEKSPKKDEFKKGTTITKRDVFALSTGVLATSLAIGTVLLLRRRPDVFLNDFIKLEEELSSTTQKFEEQVDINKEFEKKIKALREECQKLIKANGENDTVISKLTKQISSFVKLPENFEKMEAKYYASYKKILENTDLGYDPLKAPENKIPQEYTHIKKTMPLKESSLPTGKNPKSDLLKYFTELEKEGKWELEMPKLPDGTVFEKPDDAFVKNINIEGLGETINTDFKIAYGERIKWSEEKIARDIVQNFYDGHGNTLDGVKFLIEKTPENKYKIRISGRAMFNPENLRYIGSGNKVEKPIQCRRVW